MRIYIESTIPSYVVAQPARDLLQAARQQITRDWRETMRGRHELFISQVVVDEIAFDDYSRARQRLELTKDLPILEAVEDARLLAQEILNSQLLPASASRDAAHIALATVHEMDLLLTWNCRHIANAAIQTRLRRLADRAGFDLPVLCTPEELMESDDD
jgi:hypothetical protein